MIGDLVGFGLSAFLLGFMMFASIKKDNVKAGVMEFRGRVYKITDVTEQAKGISLDKD